MSRSFASSSSALPSACAGIFVGFRMAAVAGSASATPTIDKQIAVAATPRRMRTPPPRCRLCSAVIQCGDGLMLLKSAGSSAKYTEAENLFSRGARDVNLRIGLVNGEIRLRAQKGNERPGIGRREYAAHQESREPAIADDDALLMVSIVLVGDLGQRR